jgi:hypothetical protein
VYITVTRIRHQSGPKAPAVYFIQARGIDKRSKLSGRLADIDAERSVGLFAQWNVNTMQVRSAWTSLTGLDKQGSAGLLSGIDQCGEMPPIAGTMVGKGDLQYSGNPKWAEGNPPIDTSMTADSLAKTMEIDWNSIVNGDVMPADFTIPPDNFPPAGYFEADTSRWPIIRIKINDYALPNRGRGILIVDSNFVISGSNMWDGVILVGGKLTSNGINTVAGATISGLNVLLPGGFNAGESSHGDTLSVADGQKIYQYSSCKVARATKSLQRYRVLANTWADNLPSW